MGEEQKRLAVVGGGLVLALAVVLPAVSVPAPHTGGDNAAYLALAHALAGGLGYVELWDPAVPHHTKYPPVYPLLLALLVGLGATTWEAFKIASAVAVSAATLLVFAWGARRRGALAGGALALLVLLAAGWQEASRWILSEPWFLVWTFLALWASERALGRPKGTGEEGAGATGWLWPATALAGALLAFGVRTAGLPVVLAVVGAFLLARRLRTAAVMGAVSAVVVGAWMLRAARGGEGAYQSEFWLRNPYDPALGTVGLGGLLERIWTNLGLYVASVLPAEWWPAAPEIALTALGVVLVLAAFGGWLLQLRAAPGPVEAFVPLYAGMILLWPEVWSGDRFLLPLLPPLLLYSGEFAAWGVGWVSARAGQTRAPGPRPAPRRPLAPTLVVVGGLLALALPAVAAALDRAAAGGDCRARVEATGDAFACYGPGIVEFRAAAHWMGSHLPAEAVVMNRKPRIMYALGGPRGRTFPFSSDPDVLLGAADGMGARYLLVDRWDPMAARYLVPAVTARPGAFCMVGGWAVDERGGTQLLGILPPADRSPAGSEAELERCGEEWAEDGPTPEPELRRVPLLVRQPPAPESP